MCDCKTEVYSRVVGYYRPVQQWNLGKQSEYRDRVPYKTDGRTNGGGWTGRREGSDAAPLEVESLKVGTA